MSRKPDELRVYEHQDLMNELNDFIIKMKIHAGYLDDHGEAVVNVLKRNNQKPTREEIDNLQSRLLEVLKKDSSPMRKY
jgi:hypothetical protein